ncbi:CmcJ/NvfI family oxidoreductase [Rhodoferax sp. OV413]|uniref:CmcJ/NvfI family oxidoreductase n=1 Tax=Rhodoferax sp. OV413 TaxID=1855285 RepID=UPI0025CCB6FC|nr:CmcJ/NvfI family oxidoreductase [Rhodoferax sp. OV413]
MTPSQPVRATLNYSVDNGIPPDYYFYEPEPEVKLNPPGTDVQEVEIHDAWPQRNTISLDREGFELHDFDPSFKEFDDDALVKQTFYEQVVAFVKAQTGAKRVEVFDHTIRKRLPSDLKQQTEVQRPAVMLVHSDYTVHSGPQRVRDILPDEAEDLLKGRVVFFNVWKPLYRRVEELPLAMCDASTHAPGDMLRMDLKYRERTGEIYVMRHSPQHRWMYFPHMEPHHALLLKTYDSATDGRCRFMGHSAFEHPDTRPDAQKRESIEVRTMAFF